MNKFYQAVKIPSEIEKIFSSLAIETSLNEISKLHELDENEHEVFIQHCKKFLYNFDSHINCLIKDLKQYIKTGEEKTKAMADEFRETVQVPLKNALIKYYANINKETEIVFLEAGHIKITDRLIHYTAMDPPQPIDNVSNITSYRNFWRTIYTATFEVWIPEKGRWGTVDRPGISFGSEKEASDFIDILKKAIACNKIRRMQNNI